MWWSRLWIGAALLLLAACGFSPVYGPGGSGAALQDRVLVSELDTRDGYLLVRQLEDRLGRASGEVPYALDLKLDTRIEGLGIDRLGNTNRFNIVGEVDYSLHLRADQSVVLSETLTSFTGYSGTGNTVETLASERDARARLMVILADRIVARLLSLDLAS